MTVNHVQGFKKCKNDHNIPTLSGFAGSKIYNAPLTYPVWGILETKIPLDHQDFLKHNLCVQGLLLQPYDDGESSW